MFRDHKKSRRDSSMSRLLRISFLETRSFSTKKLAIISSVWLINSTIKDSWVVSKWQLYVFIKIDIRKQIFREIYLFEIEIETIENGNYKLPLRHICKQYLFLL